MYSREVLSKFIDVALQADAANQVISELMGELEQIPVEFEEDEIKPAELATMMESDEIFTENPQYKTQGKDFSIFNSDGRLILTVDADRTVRGRGGLTFTVPLSCPEDKEAFLDFCDKLQRNNAVKYPKDDE